MKKAVAIIIVGVGLILLSLNFLQSKMGLPSLNITPLSTEKKLQLEEDTDQESVKINLPSIFNFTSRLLP